MRLNEQLVRAPFAIPSPRIALISELASPYAAPGGLVCGGRNPAVARLARELALAGSHVDIFTRRAAPAQKQIVQLSGTVRVIHVPAGPARSMPGELLLPHLSRFARFMTRFARRLARPYDIVHAHYFMSGMVAQQLKLALGIPFVISFPALGHVLRRAPGATDRFAPERIRIETALTRQAERIIARCAQDRLDLEQLYGAAPGRISVAPCGFDPDECWPVPRAAARAQLGLAARRFTVLQLGRMAPRKGVDTAIQGLAMLRERHGVDAELLIVGADEEGVDARENRELARLGAFARQLGVDGQVRFIGQQPRAALRFWYGAADVFVATPWYEPFGITPVEAMACARPVIGSEVGGIKSTVVDGRTGFLIPSRDPRALAQRLALLHADPGLATRMGEEGLRRAVAQRLSTVYAAVRDETRAGATSGLPTLPGANMVVQA